MMPSPQPAVEIRWDERETASTRRLDRLDDHAGSPRGEPPEPALLPGGDDPPHGRVVFNGGSRVCDCQTPAGALRTTPDRPGRWRTAAVAPRRSKAAQRRRAGDAHLVAGRRTHKTTLRQQKIEHATTLRRDV
jgi:hypothetical protein